MDTKAGLIDLNAEQMKIVQDGYTHIYLAPVINYLKNNKPRSEDDN